MLDLLRLHHFRNYENQDFRFSPGVNVILGKNGQGKTNILESIYYLALLRSFRTQKVMELCYFGSQSFTIYGELTSESDRLSLGVSNGDKRRLSVNGVACNLASNFRSRLICAAFIPEDLNIVKGPPAARRRFLDILLCQLSMDYLHALQAYTSALHQRNIMLKQPETYSKNSITAYNHVMVKEAVKIELERRKFTALLNEAMKHYSDIFLKGEKVFSLKYFSGCTPLLQPVDEMDEASLSEAYRKALDKNYDYDCRNGSTKNGPHRSDFSCLLDNSQLSAFGSEGECRTAAMALKFSSLDILYDGVNEKNVVLLVDDVIGELDKTRRQVFFELLDKAGQVVLACTEIPQELKTVNRTFNIERGKVVSVS